VLPVFAYPKEIRRLPQTTSAIESLRMQLRKIVKTPGHFPTDEAATQLLYLALVNIQTKWRRGNHAWKAALPILAIQFGERVSTSHPENQRGPFPAFMPAP